MIISASRRTDIPAFYSLWFMNRIRAGYCTVPNPFNRNQVSYVSLRPEEVDVFVFWTRFPRPLFPHLTELNDRGYRYYFQYTLMDNPRLIDQKTPSFSAAIETFRSLADRVGPEKVIWRYDPIVFSRLTSAEYHLETYARISEALKGYTRRCVISLMDVYRKASRRLDQVAKRGGQIVPYTGQPSERFERMIRSIVHCAEQNGMEITSCAEEINLRPYGICAGKCVDDEYIRAIFGLEVTQEKDPSQREICGCVVSKDIGMYDTCLFGCQYCYATSSFERARKNYAEVHNPEAPSLIEWYNIEPNQER